MEHKVGIKQIGIIGEQSIEEKKKVKSYNSSEKVGYSKLRSQQNFSVKEQIVNTTGFLVVHRGCEVPVVITELCCYSESCQPDSR